MPTVLRSMIALETRPGPSVTGATALMGAIMGLAIVEMAGTTYGAPFVATGSVGAIVLILAAAFGRKTALACVCAIVLSFPNFNFRFRGIGDVGLDWQNAAKFVIWMALLLITLMHWRKVLSLAKHPLVLLASCSALIAMISTIWSPVPAYTFAIAAGLFAYLGFACVLTVRLDERFVLRLMSWTLGTYIAVGLIGGTVTPDLTWLPPSAAETVDRLAGFAGHPNVFAQQIGVALTALAIARRAHAISWGVFAVFGAVEVTALILTGSRTGAAAVVVAWLLVGSRETRILRPVMIIVLAATALLVFAAAVGELESIVDWAGDFSRTGSRDEILTLTGRTELWHVVWGLIREHPLLGWGYDGTEALISSTVDSSFIGSAVNAHNMYLQALLSMGFLGAAPGFACLALLIVLFVIRPDPVRDQFAILILVNGLAEVEVFSNPVLLTLVFYWTLARDARSTMKSQLINPKPR